MKKYDSCKEFIEFIMEPLPPITKEFKKFIRGLLELGGLRKKHLDSFTDKESMQYFREAFTHPSYNSDLNYEDFEMVGDKFLNAYVLLYLVDRYPDIRNTNWRTKMVLTLISGKYLAMIAKMHGFEKFIVYSDEFKQDLEEERDGSLHRDLLEDTLEAFIGALEKVVKTRGQPNGVYTSLVQNIIYKFLDQLKIDAYDHKLFFDPVTQLKEIYDAYQWDFNASIKYSQYGEDSEDAGKHIVTIFAYPFGNKTVKKSNRVSYKVEGWDKKDTKNQAAKMALEALEVFGIKPKVHDPRARNLWKRKYKKQKQ